MGGHGAGWRVQLKRGDENFVKINSVILRTKEKGSEWAPLLKPPGVAGTKCIETLHLNHQSKEDYKRIL